jgi:hypothetical protein
MYVNAMWLSDATLEIYDDNIVRYNQYTYLIEEKEHYELTAMKNKNTLTMMRNSPMYIWRSCLEMMAFTS